jgi:hypothetical protein
MTSTTNTLIANALLDAANAPEGIRIYADPNVGGYAWDLWTDDLGECQSGGIGNDRDDYGTDDLVREDNMAAVRQALLDAGYDVQ